MDQHNDFEYRLCCLDNLNSTHIRGGSSVVNRNSSASMSIVDNHRLAHNARMGHMGCLNKDLCILQLEHLLVLKVDLIIRKMPNRSGFLVRG